MICILFFIAFLNCILICILFLYLLNSKLFSEVLIDFGFILASGAPRDNPKASLRGPKGAPEAQRSTFLHFLSNFGDDFHVIWAPFLVLVGFIFPLHFLNQLLDRFLLPKWFP